MVDIHSTSEISVDDLLSPREREKEREREREREREMNECMFSELGVMMNAWPDN